MLSDNICSSDMSEVSEFTLTKKMAKHMYVLFERATWNSKTHGVKTLEFWKKNDVDKTQNTQTNIWPNSFLTFLE